MYLWHFYYSNFERHYDVLKLQNPHVLLNKNINFNKNEIELKMKYDTNTFSETNLVLQLIQKSKIENEAVELAKDKNMNFLQAVIYPLEAFWAGML